MITLTRAQGEFIRRAFDEFDETHTNSTAHATVWSRRSYAPMLIHHPQFADVRDRLGRDFPEYVIVFDVIFESNGSRVEWHCDYESLGPFEVPSRIRAIREHHFMTVHFNLTPDGGALVTVQSTLLSFIHYLCISLFGIFSWVHSAAVVISSPFLRFFGHVHSNRPLVGNVFDNTRLHAVTQGARRTSYVIRLVKRHCVGISRSSILRGITRSSACQAFVPLLNCVDDDLLDVGDVPWESVFTCSMGSE